MNRKDSAYLKLEQQSHLLLFESFIKCGSCLFIDTMSPPRGESHLPFGVCPARFSSRARSKITEYCPAAAGLFTSQDPNLGNEPGLKIPNHIGINLKGSG